MATAPALTRVHIACSAFNSAEWLDALIESLRKQTHADWQLWLRDDGSTDGTWEVVDRWRAREPRIVHAIRGDESLGSARAFASLIAAMPDDGCPVATADADDVWLPHRLEVTLRALAEAERQGAGPVLVHTDVRVVDEGLQEIAPSFWRMSDIHVERPTVSDVAVENVAIGPTLLFNGALKREVSSAPVGAIHQDWWIALVAAATGRLVAVPDVTVLYRRHGANSVATRARVSSLGDVAAALGRSAEVRRQLDMTARQAGALLAQLGDRVDAKDRKVLAGLASIPALRGWRRRLAILRWRWHPRHSVLRNLGVLFRG